MTVQACRRRAAGKKKKKASKKADVSAIFAALEAEGAENGDAVPVPEDAPAAGQHLQGGSCGWQPAVLQY